jgi:hypothetical protein
LSSESAVFSLHEFVLRLFSKALSSHDYGQIIGHYSMITSAIKEPRTESPWVTTWTISPSSILPPPVSHCAFIPARKNSARVAKILLFKLF